MTTANRYFLEEFAKLATDSTGVLDKTKLEADTAALLQSTFTPPFAYRRQQSDPADARNTLPHGNESQVAEYPGTGGRMLSESVGACSGIRTNASWRSR